MSSRAAGLYHDLRRQRRRAAERGERGVVAEGEGEGVDERVPVDGAGRRRVRRRVRSKTAGLSQLGGMLASPLTTITWAVKFTWRVRRVRWQVTWRVTWLVGKGLASPEGGSGHSA